MSYILLKIEIVGYNWERSDSCKSQKHVCFATAKSCFLVLEQEHLWWEGDGLKDVTFPDSLLSFVFMSHVWETARDSL